MIKLIIISYCFLSMFVVIIFLFYFKKQKWPSDYFHSLTQSGDTWVFSETCINYSRTKALLGPSCQESNCRYFFRVLKLLSIHQLKLQFCQLFVKSLYKGCMGMLIFRCCFSNINFVFFKQLYHFIFKFWSIITLEGLGIFEHATLFIDFFQNKCSFAWFLVLRGLATLYLDVTSIPVNTYLYVFPSKGLWGI